jgi:type IX secretion system PorP/SprF family membrane protein
MKKGFLLLICCFSMLKGRAQDNVYSQFFNAPIYLNPALNGQFDGDLRVTANYRNQWSSVGNLNYMNASIDYNIPRFGGGVGLMLNRSNEGTAAFVRNSIAGVYSYSVGSDNYTLSFGLQAGITNRQVDFSKLIFADQIDARAGYMQGSASNAEVPVFNNKYFFDSGLGVNLVTGNVMLGAALFHLNQPDESFTGTPSALPMRLTAHASYRINLDPYDNIDDADKSYIIPSVVFYKQAYASTINGGFEYKRKNISAGLWYRTDNQGGSNAIVVSLVFDLLFNRDSGEKLRFGLSHDASTSKVGYSNTSGTTEGSLSYQTPLTRDQDYRYSGGPRCYHFY